MNTNYLQFTNYTAEEDKKRLAFIIQTIHDFCGAEARVLDVGCGNGNISRALGSLGYTVTGIDISPASIQKAKALNTFNNVNFFVANAESLPVKEVFDVVVCSEVLEHLNQPENLVKDLAKLVPSGKLLVVTVPNGFGPRELLVTKPVIWLENKGGRKYINSAKKLLGYANATVQSSNEDLSHVKFFTKNSLSTLLQGFGFNNHRFEHANFIEKVFPISILAKRSNTLQKIDCKLADLLPHQLTSGFYTAWIKA